MGQSVGYAQVINCECLGDGEAPPVSRPAPSALSKDQLDCTSSVEDAKKIDTSSSDLAVCAVGLISVDKDACRRVGRNDAADFIAKVESACEAQAKKEHSREIATQAQAEEDRTSCDRSFMGTGPPTDYECGIRLFFADEDACRRVGRVDAADHLARIKSLCKKFGYNSNEAHSLILANLQSAVMEQAHENALYWNSEEAVAGGITID
jgi:hypothetical protein